MTEIGTNKTAQRENKSMRRFFVKINKINTNTGLYQGLENHYREAYKRLLPFVEQIQLQAPQFLYKERF